MQRKYNSSFASISRSKSFYKSLSECLTGTYLRKGSQLKKEELSLLVATRKEVTPNKPKHFLLAIDDIGQRLYVSSLFEGVGYGAYSFEFQGQDYELRLQDTTALIFTVKNKTDEYQ